ncbi:DUF3618 domain-containing protein [Sphaerimonospora cavernae]|uniref:DUF3618 domain-containing protein n=1 Tax=Sphaerimonospora cavernae TaxID=1740611 RepID=A0ABV6U5N2_9ACTN
MGVHRQDVAEPVTEAESRNAVPQLLDAPPAQHERSRQRGNPGDDVTRVREDIERTRDDLGDTIEALAAKADLKGRAQERMHATATLAREKAAGVADRVRAVTPEPVKGAAGKVTEQARRRPMTAATGAGTLAAGLMILRGITRMARNRRTTPKMAVQGTRGVSGLRRMFGLRHISGSRQMAGLRRTSGLRRISGLRRGSGLRRISGLRRGSGLRRMSGLRNIFGMRGIPGIGRTPMRGSVRSAGMARMRRMARMARVTRPARRGRRGLTGLFT